MPESLTLTRPDDWHVHLRDGAILDQSVRDISRYFGRAIVMPNLTPPVIDCAAATAYYHRIKQVQDRVAAGSEFEPLMVLYLTDNTSEEDIQQAKEHKNVFAVKLYPAGATTNSAQGVTDINNTFAVLETMQELGLPLLIHGELTSEDVDVFDREKRFIDSILLPLCERFPDLPVVLEHITTKDAAEFVQSASDRVAATITPHHLLFNRNQLFHGGLRPHYYCLPVLKRSTHQEALIAAATSGNAKFFLGSDSAPHARSDKESACGCAGIYTAHAALELYTEVFEQAGALDKLEGFASFYGADFYGLPRNTDTIALQKQNWSVAETLPFGEDTLVPLRAGEQVQWKVV